MSLRWADKTTTSSVLSATMSHDGLPDSVEMAIKLNDTKIL